MYCGKCGNQLIEGANFCSKCGSLINEIDEQNSSGISSMNINATRSINKVDYYKQGNGGKQYQAVKTLSIAYIVIESILLILGVLSIINLFRLVIALEDANLGALYIYPVFIFIFFGLFMLFQIKGIKKCSSGRYIVALIFGFFNACVCCGLAFNNPSINRPIILISSAVQLAVIVLMIFCNRRFKTYISMSKKCV